MYTFNPFASDQISAADNDLQQAVNARVQELIAEWTDNHGFSPSAAQESKFMDRAWSELS